MAKTIVKPKLDIVVTFQIDEEECRALDALAGYGADAVVTAFHEKIGKAYMGPHEQGLRRFLDSILEVVRPAIHQVNEARNLIAEKK